MSSYTAQSPVVVRVQFDPKANVTLDGSVPAQVFFETTIVNNEDPTDCIYRPWEEVAVILNADIVGQITTLANKALIAKKTKEDVSDGTINIGTPTDQSTSGTSSV